jgi:hypothetical protein
MNTTKTTVATTRRTRAKRPSGPARARLQAEKQEASLDAAVSGEINSLKLSLEKHHPDLYQVYLTMARRQADAARDRVDFFYRLGQAIHARGSTGRPGNSWGRRSTSAGGTSC